MTAIRALIEFAAGDLDYIHLSTIDRFRADWAARRASNLMLVSECMDVEIAQMLSKSKAHTILLRADPLSVFSHILTSQSVFPITAARIASLSFASLHDIAVKCPTLRIVGQGRTPRQVMMEIADYLSLRVSDDQVTSILINTGVPADAAVAANVPFAFPESLSIAQSLDPFMSIYDQTDSDVFEWTPALFSGVGGDGLPTDRGLDGEIPLVGPARILFYGPYMHLPVGKWFLTTRFQVTDNLSRNIIYADTMVGINVASTGRWPLPEDGRYEFTLSIAVQDPKEPVQIRLSIAEGAIEGNLSLESVRVSRKPQFN